MSHPLSVAGLLVLLLSIPMFGHELETTMTLAPPAVVIRAKYGGSDPVAFAKVQILSPGRSRSEYQNGLTDRKGQFSFVPDVPGAWLVVVDDEEGHRREITVEVSSSFALGAPTTTAAPERWMRVLTGLSLLVGLTGFLYGWKSRRG